MKTIKTKRDYTGVIIFVVLLLLIVLTAYLTK